MTSAPRAARKKLKIDVLIDSDRWKSADNIRTLVRRAVAEAASAQSTSEARACYRAHR